MSEIYAVLVLRSCYDLDGDIQVDITPRIDNAKDILLLNPRRTKTLPEVQSIIKVRETSERVPNYPTICYHEIVR